MPPPRPRKTGRMLYLVPGRRLSPAMSRMVSLLAVVVMVVRVDRERKRVMMESFIENGLFVIKVSENGFVWGWRVCHTFNFIGRKVTLDISSHSIPKYIYIANPSSRDVSRFQI